MIHAILNPLTKSDIIVYQIDCQFIKERNLLPVFPERQHSIMAAHDNGESAARELGCSANTLYQRIHKAKQLIKAEFEKYEDL